MLFLELRNLVSTTIEIYVWLVEGKINFLRCLNRSHGLGFESAISIGNNRKTSQSCLDFLNPTFFLTIFDIWIPSI